MRYDVAVVGAGIVGLGTAWAAAKTGRKVAVFESSSYAMGGSIRNFGMIWPIGQPPGDRYSLAIRNRDLWLELAALAGIQIEQCGSIHLAHHDDEWATLCEFANQFSDPTQSLELLDRSGTLRRTAAANPEGLIGGLFSPDECRVDPRQAIAAIPSALGSRFGVDFQFDSTVASIHDGDGTRVTADTIYVCSGADFARLLPELHAETGLRRCKLQMLRTVAPAGAWKLGPHLASGLTQRHYEAFSQCPSQRLVRERVAEAMPELDRYGIHVMLSQSLDGEIVIGDSHEYDAEISPFDKSLIDDLILREIRKVFTIPTWEIQQRWHGIYAKHPSQPFICLDAPRLSNVRVINGFGGAGMSLSLAVTERAVVGANAVVG
jgi:D-hydroxyproline dehydrogenase subunit beta